MSFPITESLIAGAALSSLLFGGGLFKAFIAHSNELAVQKHELENLRHEVRKDAALVSEQTTQIALINQGLAYLREALRPLEGLQSLVTGFAVQAAEMKSIKQSLNRIENSEDKS